MQTVFATMVTSPSYNYPYNLHPSVPIARRAQSLDELVS